MKKITLLNYTALCAMALSMSAISGCSDKENTFDAEDFSKKLEAFNFKTSAPVTLSVDLGASAAKQVVSIYPTEVDMISANMHTDLLYSAFTDANGRLNSNVELPAAINKVWIVSLTKPDLGVMTAEVQNGQLTLSSAQSAQARRASVANPTLFNIDDYVSIHETGNMPEQDVAQGYTTMSAVSRSEMGSFWCIDRWMPTLLTKDASVDTLYHYGKTGDEHGLKSTNATIAAHATELYNEQQAYVTANSSQIKLLDASSINQIIDGKGFENTEIELAEGTFTTEYDGAELWVTFINEGATFQNTFGYYIYKNDKEPTTRAAGYAMDRIVIWPSTSMKNQAPYKSGSLCSLSSNNWLINKNYAPLNPGDRIQLLFRDPETGAVSKRFPKGYTVGFWFCADAYNPGWHTTASSCTGLSEEYKSSLIFTQHKNRSNPWRGTRTCNSFFGNSNPKINDSSLYRTDTPTRFMQYDTKLLGEEFTLYAVEDGTDAKWNDILFAVSRKDYEKVSYAGKTLAVEPFHTISTYAFEDKWPTGGDFDMNDVIVEHDLQQIYTEDNENIIVRDEFRLVSTLDAASNRNAFYIQLPAGQEGDLNHLMVTVNGVKQENRYEAATNSIIIFTDQREAIMNGETKVVLTRDLTGTNIGVGELTYNPYLIANAISAEGESQIGEGRTEIHLPGHAITSLGKKLENSGSIDTNYYASQFVSSGSRYPFAIDFVNVADWNAPDPGVRIDETFSKYSKWCKDNGKSNTDWYYNKKGWDNRIQ